MCVPLHAGKQWYPGDGRVLPLEKALKLVSLFVRQEMRLRTALVSGDAIAIAPASGMSKGLCSTLGAWYY